MVGKVGWIFLWLALFGALPATAQPVRSGHMQAELVTAGAALNLHGNTLIGVRLTPDVGWHTYWINPGETGLATDIAFDLPQGVTAGPMRWPTPDRLPYGGVITYGYDRPVVALTELHGDGHLKPGQDVPVRVHIEALVCQQTCEPVHFDLQAHLKAGGAVVDNWVLTQALKQLPQRLAIEAGMIQKDGYVRIGLLRPQDRALSAAFSHPQGAYLFSESDQILSSAAPQAVSMGSQGFSFEVKALGTGLPATPQHFVIKLADGRAWRIEAKPGKVPVGAGELGAAKPSTQVVDNSIWGAMALAFAGGLILNLMPCVFPVLSMKLLALTRAGHDTRLARHEALMYGAGAILSFVGLSLILNLARSMGASLGWGFQLQSPIVTAILSVLMLLVGLNMSGVFEVGATLQSAAGNQRMSGNPYVAAFFTGVLAVVVAAPCSAPFMATAMGVALAQGGMASVGIFTALGLGFAAPFVGLTFAVTLMPSAARLMPRPGPWMNRLRHGLAIPMYLAAIWMVWVFAQQTGVLGTCLLIGGMALLGLCLVSLAMPKAVRGAAWFVAILLCGTAAFQKPDPLQNTSLAFSPAQITDWQAQNRPVLVDMTAAWCVTCKVNERIALSNPKVLSAIAATHTVYMVGDWTHQDAAISDYIHQFGRSGVPLYVYYGPGHQAPVILPQVLTPGMVVRVLKTGHPG